MDGSEVETKKRRGCARGSFLKWNRKKRVPNCERRGTKPTSVSALSRKFFALFEPSSDRALGLIFLASRLRFSQRTMRRTLALLRQAQRLAQSSSSSLGGAEGSSSSSIASGIDVTGGSMPTPWSSPFSSRFFAADAGADGVASR